MKQTKLLSYLAVTAGVGCASSAANAAVVFYGAGKVAPSGLRLESGFGLYAGQQSVGVGTGAYFALPKAGQIFTRGDDNSINNITRNGGFIYRGTSFWGGGATAGKANFANVTFGQDDVYEAVVQYSFDGLGGGYLVAIAIADGTTLQDGVTPLTGSNAPSNWGTLKNTGSTSLSISAGKAMIDAAAVPEPSGLCLLALGAMGLAARRQRRKAA